MRSLLSPATLIICYFSLVTVFGQEKRLALVTGISDYQNNALSHSLNDSRSVRDLLKSLDFEVIYLENPSSTDLKKSVNQFGERLYNYDVGLFYYSGHALPHGDENYLIPAQASIYSQDDVEYEGVRLGRVLSKMNAANTGVKIILLDASRRYDFLSNRGFKSTGLVSVDAPSGTYIGMSSKPGSSHSHTKDGKSLFTSALVDKINNSNQKIEDIFKEVRLDVFNGSGDQQVTWESSSLVNDFIFNPNLVKKETPVVSSFDDELVEEVAEEVFTIVEVQPEFPGGMTAFYQYLASKMVYPKKARKQGIQGTVFVQYVVTTEGEIEEVKAIKKIGGGCDEEAERVLRKSPRWKPGLQRGKPVKVRMILPINFRFTDE